MQAAILRAGQRDTEKHKEEHAIFMEKARNDQEVHRMSQSRKRARIFVEEDDVDLR
jgi:hypothetical protein